uniref:Uncharacterized protein n=1 Tax=Meloidogyne javanica TaxID=6303 RepID=A0A915LC15_MELJA
MPSNLPLHTLTTSKSIYSCVPGIEGAIEGFGSFGGIKWIYGKCSVQLVKDLRTALAEIDFGDDNAFFHCLNYNQESGRLASCQMSIKVGSAYQANIPSCSSSTLSDDPDRDELLYRPGYLCPETEDKYVKMARTFRTFSLMNNKRITILEKSARTGDLLLDDAVVALHRSGYSVMDAINTMQAIDTHLTTDSSFMNADDVKKFGRGIKQYGKNFNKINKDLLGNHRREQLIAFYYLWKKSANATRPKPLGNSKRTQVSVASFSRRARTTANSTFNGIGNGGKNALTSTAEGGTPPPSNDSGEQVEASNKSSNGGGENSISPLDELQDYASASEAETEQLDSQSGGVGRACHHCFSSKSVDWHHAGHDRLLLMCTECRIFYKRYGQLRPVERPSTVPPCLLMPANTTTSRQDSEEEDENEEPFNGRSNRLRTRGGGSRLLPQRTPSSLDLLESGGEQRLRGTPQKLEEEQQRRSTPLRNSAGKTGRKRGGNNNRGGGDSVSFLLKRVRTFGEWALGKWGNLGTDDSRTPSPPTTTVNVVKEDNEQNENSNNNTRKRISKKEKLKQEKINKDKMESSDDNNAKKVKLERADSHAGVVTPQPATENTTTITLPSPIIETCITLKEEQIADDLPSKQQKKSEKHSKLNIETSQVSSPKNSPPIGAATIISRKPVAKVEPLETNKEEIKNEIIEQIQQQTSQQQEEEVESCKIVGGGGEEEEPSNNTTIICVVSSDDEEGGDEKEDENKKEWEQDCGPLGEVDSTEIYRTGEGKKDSEGKLIPIESRTILERRLKRVSGLTCARTDIAYLESPERARHNLQKRERERLKKEQERAAKQQHKQMNVATIPVVQPLKKMEMPAEFGGQQHQQQPSLVYLPNGATIPCVSGNNQQQQQLAALHHPMILNGTLLPGNNIVNIPGGGLSQFNSFAAPQQSNEVSSTFSSVASSTLPNASTTLPASTSLTTPQAFQQPQQQQHPLVAIGGNHHQLINNQQNLQQPSALTPLVNQPPANAAALFHQQQQQQQENHKSKKESTSLKNQHQQQNQQFAHQQQNNDALMKQLFYGAQHQQPPPNIGAANNLKDAQQPAEMEAICNMFQQPQNNNSASINIQPQQLQEMLGVLAAGGAGLSQQDQRPSSSSTNNNNNSAFFQQQQFQQQFLQFMAMQQQQQQHQNVSLINNSTSNNQQQLTPEQQHLFQQQLELLRRQQQHNQNVSSSNPQTLQQRTPIQEQQQSSEQRR